MTAAVATKEAPEKERGAPGRQIGTIDWAVAKGSPMGDEFSALVVDSLNREGNDSAHRIYLVDLGGIRHALGERWDRFKDMVVKTARESIDETLSGKDFSRVFNDAYLLVFGDCPRVEREYKCLKIAWHISRTLFGEDGKVQDIAVQRVEVGPDQTIGLNSLWREAPVERLLASLAVELKLCESDRGISDKSGLAPGEGPVDFIYRPMWYTERKVVSNFMCMPAYQEPGGNLLVGDGVLPLSGNARAVKALDFLTLRRVIHDLTQGQSSKQNFIIGYPLHFQTMQDPDARAAYLDLCEAIPEAARKLSIIEIVGLPAKLEGKEAGGLIAAWRPFARAVLARTRIHQTEFVGYKAAGVIGVGADLSETSRPESELIPHMETFSETASKAKLKAYVHGLRSISMTTAAVCAGFDYVDGDAITSLAEAPTKSYPLSVESLYAHLVKPAAPATAGK